jgi:hypothetical protein
MSKTETKATRKNVIFADDYFVTVFTVEAHDDDDAIAQAEQMLADEFGSDIGYNEVTVAEA